MTVESQAKPESLAEGRGITLRYIVALVTTVLIAMAIFGGVAALVTFSRLDQRIRQEADQIASSIATSMATPLWNIDEQTIGDLLGASLTNKDIVYAQVTDGMVVRGARSQTDSIPIDLHVYRSAGQYAMSTADVLHDQDLVIGRVDVVMSRDH